MNRSKMARRTAATALLGGFLVLVVAGLAAPDARAERPALPAFTGYVVDQAHVLDPDAVARITAIASRLDHAGTAQLAVATLPSLGDSTVEETAVRLFEQWGLGHNKARSDGVLVLYVPGPPGQRKTRVEVGYGLEGILPDGKTGALIRAHSSPLVRENKFGEAAVALATAIAQVIDADAAAGGESAPSANSPRRGSGVGMAQSSDGRRSWPLVSLAMGALFVWLFITYVREEFPGRLHAAGGALLAGVAVYAIATASGIAGFVVLAVGLLVNSITWAAIIGHRCAKCGGWAEEEREVVQEATIEAEGLARVTRRCKYCLDASVKGEILPRKTPAAAQAAASGASASSDYSSWDSSNDSSSSSSDFSGGGGGESGGGGASSSD